jgi:hypothetical protein
MESHHGVMLRVQGLVKGAEGLENARSAHFFKNPFPWPYDYVDQNTTTKTLGI